LYLIEPTRWNSYAQHTHRCALMMLIFTVHYKIWYFAYLVGWEVVAPRAGRSSWFDRLSFRFLLGVWRFALFRIVGALVAITMFHGLGYWTIMYFRACLISLLLGAVHSTPSFPKNKKQKTKKKGISAASGGRERK